MVQSLANPDPASKGYFGGSDQTRCPCSATHPTLVNALRQWRWPVAAGVHPKVLPPDNSAATLFNRPINPSAGRQPGPTRCTRPLGIVGAIVPRPIKAQKSVVAVHQKQVCRRHPDLSLSRAFLPTAPENHPSPRAHIPNERSGARLASEPTIPANPKQRLRLQHDPRQPLIFPAPATTSAIALSRTPH